jgi:hypothetical protein
MAVSPASLLRICADHGFGVRLTNGGVSLVPPTAGEVPPDEVIEALKANREALIDHLKSGGETRCVECRSRLWLDAATGPEIGAACDRDGLAEFDTAGAGEPSLARFLGVRARCPWKRTRTEA